MAPQLQRRWNNRHENSVCEKNRKADIISYKDKFNSFKLLIKLFALSHAHVIFLDKNSSCNDTFSATRDAERTGVQKEKIPQA